METTTSMAASLIESIGTLRRQLRGGVGMPWPKADLSSAELELLRLVRRRCGIGIGRAAAELGLAPNTVSTLVTRLAERGALLRLTDPDDSRAICLRLSPSAQRHIEKWRDARTTTLSEALGKVSPADRQLISAALPALDRLLDQLRDNSQVRS